MSLEAVRTTEAPDVGPHPWRRFVAIGDSFTEGVGDELPDGTVRGWADLAAAGLAAATGEAVAYANLAVRGRLLEPIVTEQVPAALALTPAPTLLTLNGGGNDIMRPGVDTARLVELTEQAVRRVVDKLLHTPTVRVKELADSTSGVSYAEALQELFGLDRKAPAAVVATGLALEES